VIDEPALVSIRGGGLDEDTGARALGSRGFSGPLAEGDRCLLLRWLLLLLLLRGSLRPAAGTSVGRGFALGSFAVSSAGRGLSLSRLAMTRLSRGLSLASLATTGTKRCLLCSLQRVVTTWISQCIKYMMCRMPAMSNVSACR